MFGSVNSAYAAQISLRTLAATSASLQRTQTRLATGLKIASAKDNGATWAVAQTQAVQVASLDPVKDSLNTAKSVLDLTLSAGSQLVDLLRQMKQKALAASDAGATDDTRAASQTEFNALLQTYANVVASATFNGVNLIDEGTTSLSALGSADGQVRVGSAHAQLDAASLFGDVPYVIISDAAMVQAQAPTGVTAQQPFGNDPIIRPIRPIPIQSVSWADGSGAVAAGASAQTDDALATVTAALSTFGVDSRAVDNQLRLVSNLQDILTAGVGNLVDADMAKEGARRAALQVRQKLSAQALSSANAAPKMLLGLFRTSARTGRGALRAAA